MSIATKHGDGGETALAGGVRVSKSNLRVDAYGTVDELISAMGLARAICERAETRELTEKLQRELFTVGGALATAPDSKKKPRPLDLQIVDALTAHVERIEAIPGMLSDWAVPGGHPAAAAFDVARTVCRRAERLAVALRETGEPVDPVILAYLNRLSDLLWLLGRELEKEAGVDARLREDGSGPGWSRAW